MSRKLEIVNRGGLPINGARASFITRVEYFDRRIETLIVLFGDPNHLAIYSLPMGSKAF